MTNYIRLQIMYLNEYYYCYMLKLMQKLKLKKWKIIDRLVANLSFLDTDMGCI